MHNTIKVLIVIGLFFIGLGMAGIKVFERNSKQKMQDEINHQVVELNKHLPKKLDSVVTMTAVEYDGKVLRYTAKLDFGVDLSEAMKQRIRDYVTTYTCKNVPKELFRLNLNMAYKIDYTPYGTPPQTLEINIPAGSCL